MLNRDGPLRSAVVTRAQHLLPAARVPLPVPRSPQLCPGTTQALSLPPPAEPGGADGSSTGELGKMKPQPRVSREGDGRVRNPRPFSCSPRRYCPVAAALPTPHRNCPDPWARTSEPQISSGWQKPARFGGGRTRDLLAFFFARSPASCLAETGFLGQNQPGFSISARKPEPAEPPRFL